MSLEGELTRLRALEAEDVDLLYVWENDPAVWGVSGTLAPFSRHTLRRFLDEQRFDLYAARQLRLVVETLDGRAVGLVDLFEFEPVDLRAGIGILIHGAELQQQPFSGRNFWEAESCGSTTDILLEAAAASRRTHRTPGKTEREFFRPAVLAFSAFP